MILLSIIVAVLGVISIACLCVAMWPDRREPMDELEARRRLRPDGRFVERFECRDPDPRDIPEIETGPIS